MGTLARMGLLAGAGGLLYNWLSKRNAAKQAAPVFSSGVTRDAGPEQQSGVDRGQWDKIDEQADESFPASDPPANY